MASTTYILDGMLSSKLHILGAALTSNSSALNQDLGILKLVPRIQFDRSLLYSRRALAATSSHVRKGASTRLLQMSSSQPAATQVVIKNGITLILFDSNNQVPRRTIIYAFNQTVLFETTIDKLNVICKAMDFVFQPPLTVHVFLLCEDKFLRYVRATVDKLDTTSTISLTHTRATYFSDKLTVVWNGGAAYDTFYLGMIDYADPRNPVYRFLAANVQSGVLNVKERYTVQQAIAYSVVSVSSQERYWVCSVFNSRGEVDESNNLRSLCVDKSVAPLGDDNLSVKLAPIVWPQEPSLPVKGMSCFNDVNTSPSQVICDLSLQGVEVVELRLQLITNDTTASFQISSSTTYFRYGDNFGHLITSSPDYFACTTYSLNSTQLNQILLFRRTRATFGSAYVYYSIPASDILPPSPAIPTNSTALSYSPSGIKFSPLETLSMAIFVSPIDAKTKLLVVDANGGSLGRVYKIGQMMLEVGSVGFYEMERWREVLLTVNPAIYPIMANTSLFSIFWSANTPDRDVRDGASWGAGVLSAVKYWLYGMLILLILGSPLVVYYYRREKLKKFTGSE